jgi:2-desacetyl-2-hydroxyethyl bacteriochlorophyllide A dehydrogenase
MPHTRAILCTSENVVQLAEIEVPPPASHQVLIRNRYTLISPGTELRCIGGKQPGLTEYPFIPGYTAVGEVIEGNPTIPAGTVVLHSGTKAASVPTAWGGHVELSVTEPNACTVLPEGLDPLHASGAKLFGIAHRGMRLAEPAASERVAVLGLGAIGQASARLFAASGALVIGIDRVEDRRTCLTRIGIPAMTPEEAISHLKDYFNIVVDASGSEAAISTAIELASMQPWGSSAGSNSRVIIQGSYSGSIPIPYQEAFRKELQFRFPRDVTMEDVRIVIDLHQRRKLNLGDIVSRTARPQDAQAAYDELRSRPGTISIAFDWS